MIGALCEDWGAVGGRGQEIGLSRTQTLTLLGWGSTWHGQGHQEAGLKRPVPKWVSIPKGLECLWLPGKRAYDLCFPH